MLLHSHISQDDISPHMGKVVKFELQTGEVFEGRVIAWDYTHVYLGRTRHETMPFTAIKRIVEHPPY